MRKRPCAWCSVAGYLAGESEVLRMRRNLALHQDLEALAHAFGVDQRLELQARANLVCLRLARVVEVGKLVGLSQRQQKSGLRSELRGFQARPLSPVLQRRKIRVRRQILLSRRGVEVLAYAMLLIRQERPAHVPFVEELCRTMTVIDGQHESALDAPADFRNPVARFESRFRLLAFAKRDVLHRKIVVEDARGNRGEHIDKSPVVAGHQDFLHFARRHHHTIDSQGIDQFIREDAARPNLRGNFLGNPHLTGRRIPLQPLRSMLAPRRRTLHRDVTQRGGKIRQLFFAEIQDVPGEPPHARPRFHQQKLFRPLELLPHLGKFAPEQPAKNRMHVHTRVVIGEPLRFLFAVIAVHRMVQAFAHEVGKTDGAVAAHALGEQFSERRHAPLAPAVPEASSDWSFFQLRSNISLAASSRSTKCTASSEVSPRKCSTASRNMMLAHSSSGNPATPVPTAGKAMDFKPRSFAIFKQCIVELRSASPVVAPPSRMLAAWITNRAFNFPAVVMAAYPTGMLPISLHSRWMASPPLRRMAPATPPPRIKSLFAALTMASVSISVKSPCWMRILSARGFLGGIFFSASKTARIHTFCGVSFTTATSLPMRHATSRHMATVSSEVYGVRNSSIRLHFETGREKWMPMQRSRETTMSVKSVIEREEAVLAKIAPAFANLSKTVKSSSFISSSSGTVSMISSASRIASFTSVAVESRESALPLKLPSNLPLATPSAKDCRIQASASSSRCGEISSSTVLYPPRAEAYAILRPIAPAPITAMVLTAILCWSPANRALICSSFLLRLFVKPQNHWERRVTTGLRNRLGSLASSSNRFTA